MELIGSSVLLHIVVLVYGARIGVLIGRIGYLALLPFLYPNTACSFPDSLIRDSQAPENADVRALPEIGAMVQGPVKWESAFSCKLYVGAESEIVQFVTRTGPRLGITFCDKMIPKQERSLIKYIANKRLGQKAIGTEYALLVNIQIQTGYH